LTMSTYCIAIVVAALAVIALGVPCKDGAAHSDTCGTVVDVDGTDSGEVYLLQKSMKLAEAAPHISVATPAHVEVTGGDDTPPTASAEAKGAGHFILVSKDAVTSKDEAALVPSSEHNQLVLVLGGMMNQRDLDLAGDMTEKAGAQLVIYNNHAGEAGDCGGKGTIPGKLCGQSCDKLRLPKGALCTDVPNMGRSEAAFFRYVYDHYSDLGDKQIVFSAATVSSEFRDVIVPDLLNGPANGDVVPRCFTSTTGARPLSTEWEFGFTQKCDKGIGRNTKESSCNWCRANESAKEGEVIDGTAFGKGAIPCEVSWAEHVSGPSSPIIQRPTVMCAAHPNTVGQWLMKHAPSPGGGTGSPACFRGVFRTHGDALRKRSRDDYRNIMRQVQMCSNPEAAHFVERTVLYLFASV